MHRGGDLALGTSEDDLVTGAVGMLDGIRVLSVTREAAGQLAGVLLAELGADVARIDDGVPCVRPRDWLLRRSVASVSACDGLSRRGLVEELVRGADIVLCDLPDGEAASVGADAGSVHRVSPAATIVRISPYGREGRFASLPADWQVAAALSGHSGSQWAFRDGGIYSLPDYGSNAAAVLGAIAALSGRFGFERTGQARVADTSLLAGWLALRSIHAVTGVGVTSVSVRDPQGGLSPTMRVYRAGDGGWVLIACSTPPFWTKLCVALDLIDLAADQRFEHAPFGVPPEHRSALIEILERRLADKPRDVWIARLRSHDVPCAPVQSPAEAMREAQLVTNGSLVELEQPGLGLTRQLGSLIRFDGFESTMSPARDAGADTDLVRARWSTADRPALATPSPSGSPELPLAGVRVLEICNWVAGPAAGGLLRQLGAEVWKIEALAGDSVRSLVYVYRPINAGKDVLRLDPASPRGRQVLDDLIRAADVVLHNNRPALAESLGFDARSVHALNPSAVFHEVLSYGRKGELAGDPAFDQIVPARAGLMWLQGGMSQGHPPVLHNGSQGDLPAAYVAVLAVCAGLLRRARSATPCLASWSVLLEAGYLLNHDESIDFEGRPAQSEGGVDFLGPDPSRRLYPTRDGWVLLAARHRGDWDTVEQVLGIGLPPYQAACLEPAEGPTGAAIAARLVERTSDEWENDALAAGLTMVWPRPDREVVRQDYVVQNGLDGHLPTEQGDDVAFPAYFIRFDGQGREGRLRPPDSNDGGRRILAAIGRSDEEIDAMIDAGVVAIDSA